MRLVLQRAVIDEPQVVRVGSGLVRSTIPVRLQRRRAIHVGDLLTLRSLHHLLSNVSGGLRLQQCLQRACERVDKVALVFTRYGVKETGSQTRHVTDHGHHQCLSSMVVSFRLTVRLAAMFVVSLYLIIIIIIPPAVTRI